MVVSCKPVISGFSLVGITFPKGIRPKTGSDVYFKFGAFCLIGVSLVSRYGEVCKPTALIAVQ